MFRRGKLTFLNIKDDRIKIMNERINLAERNLVHLCNTFARCTRKMAKCRDACDDLARDFKNYSDDEDVNESLSEGMKNFTNAISILGDLMDVYVHRMEHKIVNELAVYENTCKTTRENLRTAQLARDKEVVKQRQILELKTKFSANNSATDSDLLKAKQEVFRTNKEIDDIINNFEQHKLSNIKRILIDFVLISMKYHTKILEALTATYYDVSNIDEQNDFIAFQKHINSNEDVQKEKSALKKGMKSQSSFENSKLNRNKKGRLAKKDANNTTEEDNDDDDDEDDETESNEEDDDDTLSADSEDEDSEQVTDDSETAHGITANKIVTKKSKLGKTHVKQPFKAAVTKTTASNVFKHKPQLKSKPFAAKSGIGIPKSQYKLRTNSTVDDRQPVTSIGIGAASGRLVTVVESKKKSSMKNGEAGDTIDCTRKFKE